MRYTTDRQLNLARGAEKQRSSEETKTMKEIYSDVKRLRRPYTEEWRESSCASDLETTWDCFDLL